MRSITLIELDEEMEEAETKAQVMIIARNGRSYPFGGTL
jgi:hypothetical protein